MRDLIAKAKEFGLQVHGSHLGPGVNGYYSPTEGRIYFDLLLTPNERRATVGHELGHAYHGHACSNPRHERQANTYAANLLIDPRTYATIENVSSDAHFIADELGVTVELVLHFRSHCLQRLGQRTYSTSASSPLTPRLARTLSTV